MDTKRLIIFFALAIVIVAAYQYFFMPTPPPQPKQVQTASPEKVPEVQKETIPKETETKPGELPDIFSGKTETAAVQLGAQAEAVTENISGTVEKNIVVENELYRAVFISKGAGLKSFVLKKYKDDKKKPLDLISKKVNEKFGPYEVYPFYFSPFDNNVDKRKFFLGLNTLNYAYNGNTEINLADKSGSQSQGTPNETVIEFKFSNIEKNLSVVKRFTLSSGSYVLKVDYKVTQNGKVIEAPILFGPDLEDNINGDRIMQTGLTLASYNGDDVDSKEFKSFNTQKEDGGVEKGVGLIGSNFYWAAYDTTYFAAIFKTREKIEYAVIKYAVKDTKKLYSYIILTESKPLLVFLGPKDEQILASVEKNYQFDSVYRVVDYGSFIFPMGPIARIMHKGIILVYNFFPNMGWAVVFFTIFIKILLFPLTYASSVSMAKTQTLAPKVAAIKKKYKNTRDIEQKKMMNTEIMALYKQEKINPAGGCLPMLLQLPILFAFFRLFPISISFRHEPWVLWIQDLSVKDPFYVLPILMGLTMVIVSKMSPTTADGAMQKYMMYFLPVIMTVFCMSYSSGLTLYWFVSNLLQIGQQYIINKKVYKEKKVEEKEIKALKRKKGGKAL